MGRVRRNGSSRPVRYSVKLLYCPRFFSPAVSDLVGSHAAATYAVLVGYFQVHFLVVGAGVTRGVGTHHHALLRVLGKVEHVVELTFKHLIFAAAVVLEVGGQRVSGVDEAAVDLVGSHGVLEHGSSRPPPPAT